MLENLATHYINWLSFRIHNEIKHNNTIFIKTKNVIAANDIATKVDLIKNKEAEIEKVSMSISVTVDNEINLKKFIRKRSDRWHLKNINTQNWHEKKVRKLNAY